VLSAERKRWAGILKTPTQKEMPTRALKPPRSWTIQGLWFNDTDGQTRADQIRAWVEPGLRTFEVTTDRYLNQVELGMACEIDSYPRFSLSGGFAGIVAGWREAPVNGRVTLILIG